MDRRQVLIASMALSIAAIAASRVHGQPQSFAPPTGRGSTFEVTNFVEIPGAADATQASVPSPGIDTK